MGGGNSRYFRKKIQKLFQVEKNPTLTFKIGGILEKKCYANFLKLRSKLVYREMIHNIYAKNFKNFFKRNKIQLHLQNRRKRKRVRKSGRKRKRKKKEKEKERRRKKKKNEKKK